MEGMKMRRLFIVVIMVAAVVMLSLSVLAGTPCSHFTHNRHDTLLIGEIIAIGDETLVIKPAGFIISAGRRVRDGAGNYTMSDREVARNLRREAARQLRPEVAVVFAAGYTGWPGWQPRGADGFSVGDYVIASLDANPGGYGFVVAWGIFLVDSLDYRTLRVDAMCFAGTYDFYTYFVNSRGYGGYFIPAGEEPPGAGMRYLIRAAMVIGTGVAAIFVGGVLAGRLRTRRQARGPISITPAQCEN